MPRNTGTNIYTIPPDTEGIPDQTIESATYNIYLHDVEKDLNDPRPIIAGGTGANDADEALVNLGAEKATQLVTNYDTHVWVPGSFRSAGSATAGPIDGHAFAGIVYLNEPYLNPPTNANVIVSARDMNDTVVPSRVYVREKKGTWGAWAIVDASTTTFPPGGGLSATTILAAIQELDAEKAAITYVDTKDAGLQTQINSLDTEKADIIYVNEVGGSNFDGFAYLGVQTNGSFIVNQDRQVGISNTLVGLVTLTDGWNVFHGTVSNSTIDFGPRGMNFYTHRNYNTPPAPAASDSICLITNVEGYRAARATWGGTYSDIYKKPITISFISAHSKSGLYCVAVRNAASDRSYVATYNHTINFAEEYQTITIPPDIFVSSVWNKDSGVGFNIVFGIAVGSNYHTTPNTWIAGNKFGVSGMTNCATNTSDRFIITGVMIHHGLVAPPVDRVPYLVRPYEQELFLCQRYFQRFLSTSSGTPLASGIASSTTTAIFPIRFPTPMRIGPTLDGNPVAANFVVVAAAGSVGATAISSNVAYNTPEGARVDITTAGGLVAGQGVLLQAASFPTTLGFSARM